MMTMQEKALRWEVLLQEQKESDLSIKDWCQKQNISTQTFSNWRKRLQEDSSVDETEEVVFAEVPFKALASSTTESFLTIKYGEVEILLTSENSVDLAVSILRRLQMVC